MYRQHVAANLCGTSVTIDFVKDALEGSIGIHCELDAWKAEKIGVGQGFLSHIIRVQFQWNDEDTNLPESVVVKVPASIPNMIADSQDWEKFKKGSDDGLLRRVHDNECAAYQWLTQTQHAHNIPFPKIYMIRTITGIDAGLILMEDLTSTSYTQKMADGFSLGQLLSVAEALSSLHASCLTHEGWGDRFYESPRIKYDQLPDIYEKISEMLKQRYPDYFGQIEEVEQFFDADKMYDAAHEAYKELGIPPVIVHGDLWSNNMLFDNLEPDKLAALIDWQAIHKGNLCEDLARVLISCVTPERRREETETVIKFYYDRLHNKLGSSLEITLEQVQQAYHRVVPAAMCFFIAALPFIVNSPIVEGENKEENVEHLLQRGKAVVEDLIAMH